MEPNLNTQAPMESTVNGIRLLMSLKKKKKKTSSFGKSKFTQDNYNEEQWSLLNHFLNPRKKCLTSHRIQITNRATYYLVPNTSHHIKNFTA